MGRCQYIPNCSVWDKLLSGVHFDTNGSGHIASANVYQQPSGTGSVQSNKRQESLCSQCSDGFLCYFIYQDSASWRWNPKYIEYKQSCDSLKSQMESLKREDPLFTTLYVRAYGEYRQQLGNQSLSINDILQKYGGTLTNVPGDCVKQRIQAEIDGNAADQLSTRLDKLRSEKEALPSIMFLKTYFPDIFSDKFKTINNTVIIRDGGEMVGAANSQFFNKLKDPKMVWSLGFSLFWMFVSIILSLGAVFLLWSKSRSEDMKMSYSNELLLEREKFLQGYTNGLDEYQVSRRQRILSTNSKLDQGN